MNGVGDRHNLVKSLALANHAQIGPRAFFGRVSSLLKINHLGIERGVSGTQRLIQRALFGNRGSQVRRLPKTVVREPELGLKTKSGDPQHYQ